MQSRYRIYELSAKAIMSYAQALGEDKWVFDLDGNATLHCIAMDAPDEQDDNALFFQTMCVLHGDGYEPATDERLIEDLSDIIIYISFSGVFEHLSGQKKYTVRQKKAECMFSDDGIVLDMGGGKHHYLPFERSGNMSRKATLSFIRSDFYEPVRERIMLGMKIGMCQLSKLYAYNGLMLSGGVRIDVPSLFKEDSIIVVDNDKSVRYDVNVISVEGEEAGEGQKKYHRVEKKINLSILRYDGEGIISKKCAALIDRKCCGEHIHSSFQIRLPFIKGMLHEIDFHDFFREMGITSITDIWGIKHPVSKISIILTKSQFKGFGWLGDSNMTWSDYLSALRKYRHAIYITNVSKESPESFTELNYQFLSTVDMTAAEFRPLDLHFGWKRSPEEDSRYWITKETELAYYRLCCDRKARLDYFLEVLKLRGVNKSGREYILASILRKNPLMIGESVYQSALIDKMDSILKQYSLGRLIVKGDNRFLSDDLLEFMVWISGDHISHKKKRLIFSSEAKTIKFKENAFFAPGAKYSNSGKCTLLRNPHISRNEELQLNAYGKFENMRNFYIGGLTDVIIPDPASLAAERLGGADFDGDMVKTIADPILNKCVNRNYRRNGTKGQKPVGEDDISPDIYKNIPLLHIPTEEPRIRDASDWHAKYEIVRDTFSSRVGLISNTAFRKSVIAYNENSDAEEREKLEHEIEMLAILTGLEIDSAKSGIKPDLSEYLSRSTRTGRKSIFLRYKELVSRAEGRREWYEPTYKKRLQAFFDSVDWDNVSSNVERLPYLSMMFEKHTPRLREKPAADEELFVFAQTKDWKDELDQPLLNTIKCLLDDYDACLSRIRACRAPLRTTGRMNDIDRILFSRGQEDVYDTDELYALFRQLPDDRIGEMLESMGQHRWQYLKREDREELLSVLLPEHMFEDYIDLLCDFRCGGFRLLGDILLDIYEEITASDRKRYIREGDSNDFHDMMEAFLDKPFSVSAREAVSAKCREIIKRYTDPGYAVRYFAALGKRKQMFDILPDRIEENLIRRRMPDA